MRKFYSSVPATLKEYHSYVTNIFGINNTVWFAIVTLIFLPPIITPFICSRASCAASGKSYSTNANPLCFWATGSQDILIVLIGPSVSKSFLYYLIHLLTHFSNTQIQTKEKKKAEKFIT